jgi:RNA polymerase sigma-70 factor, ECF subfamily
VISDLVERAQRGDHEAFDGLATAAYHRLYAIARRILRDGYAAEDAVQETLVDAWQNIRSVREPDRFEAWLHRLLVRACHDEVRRAKRRPLAASQVTRLEVPGGERFDRPSSTDDLKQLVDQDEIERAFLALSVEHRAVLVLTHYVGLPAAEVAGILRIPLGTVYSRLHYGVRAMRDALAPAPPTPMPSPEHGR